jgi:hypothetical protein
LRWAAAPGGARLLAGATAIASGAKLEEGASVISQQLNVVLVEVLVESVVIVQPPERRFGEEQILRAPGVESLQVGDRGFAIGGVIAGENPGFVLWKVGGLDSAKPQQLIIPPADDQNASVVGQVGFHASADLVAQILVLLKVQPG